MEFWHPRDLKHVDLDFHEYKHEKEALYPAGAEFKVMEISSDESDINKPLTVIKLKLMDHST